MMILTKNSQQYKVNFSSKEKYFRTFEQEFNDFWGKYRPVLFEGGSENAEEKIFAALLKAHIEVNSYDSDTSYFDFDYDFNFEIYQEVTLNKLPLVEVALRLVNGNEEPFKPFTEHFDDCRVFKAFFIYTFAQALPEVFAGTFFDQLLFHGAIEVKEEEDDDEE